MTNTIYLGGPEALEMMEIVSGVDENLDETGWSIGSSPTVNGS